MKYISHYSKELQLSVLNLIENKKLSTYILNKYPSSHNYKNDKKLYEYIINIKNQYLKKYHISKAIYDNKINVIDNALGMHTFISKVQGNKLKSKNEIKISTIFKNTPEEFLKMIITHELAHFKQKDHNKAFYDLCTHIMPNYHQVEFDLRVYLLHIDKFGKLY